MVGEIRYEVHSSQDLDDGLIFDFLEVFNSVFNLNHDKIWFDWKYTYNIYGQSYIVYAYDGDQPVGIRSFWRNDLEDEAYQVCDTAVQKDYRLGGVFREMNRQGLERLKDKTIYAFPIEETLETNLDLGFRAGKNFYLKTVFSRRRLKRETFFIEDDFLTWRFRDCPKADYHYYKSGEDYYLLINRIKNIYYVLGRFSGDYREAFIEAKKPFLINYSEKETKMYKVLKNKARLLIFDNNKELPHLPIFKADFF